MIRNAFLSALRGVVVLSMLVVVAACTAPKIIPSAADSAFQRTGRFAVSISGFDGTRDAVQGGFSWLDTGQTLTLDLANPLGSTLARVTLNDGLATLTHSNGAKEYASDAEGLVEKILGSPVPVTGLRDWLRGRTGTRPVENLHKDRVTGEPIEFMQDGWRVKLSRYDVLGPTLLQLNRRGTQGDVSVRLAISTQSVTR